MKRTLKLICLLVLQSLALMAFSQHKKFNMVQLSRWDNDSLSTMGLQSYNDVWGWYDTVKKREYAIVGTVDSTYFFDVTNPFATPIKCDAEAGRSGFSIWRDYDTYSHYCYAVQDANVGALQIFDMSYLPDSVHKVYQSDSLLYRSHTIFRSGDKLYCNSATTRNGTRRASQILSLADPENPTLAGIITPPIFGGTAAFNFCHDTYVRHDTAYCSGETSGLYIFDVSNPANPKYLAAITDYPEKGYNHSSWTTDDGKYIFFTDENHGLGIKAFEIDNFANMDFQSVFRSNPGAIAHNPYIRGNFLYVSYYEDGVYVFDIRNPKNPQVVAYYDTHPQNNEGQYRGFYGCWSVYPFLPSGIVLALDQTNGLFVLKADATISVEEMGVETFNVYPNPLNSDNLSVSLLNHDEREVTVTITDALGVEVYRSQQAVEEGLNNLSVQMPEGAKAGIYFVTITGRISNICKKILKP